MYRLPKKYNAFKGDRNRVSFSTSGNSSRAVTSGAGGSGGSRSGRGAPPRMVSSNRRRPRGMRRRGRRISRRRKMKRILRPVNHSKNGVCLVYENTSVTSSANDDAEVVYIGHANGPAKQVLTMAIRAIVKATFARMGVQIRDFGLAVDIAGIYQFSYYPNATATAFTNSNFNFIATNTYNDIVASFVTTLFAAMESNPALRPYQVAIAPTGSTPRIYYLDSCMLNLSMFSRLKIQNRTPNEGGTDEVDTNDINFLVGNKYSGTGTGTYVTSQTSGGVPHQPLIAENDVGTILRTRTDNFNGTSNQWLRHPPETTKFFTRVKSLKAIPKFAPGATKYSSLSTNRRISFAFLIDQYLKQINTNTYTLSSIGEFAFFGFQKYIDDDEAVKVKIAFEIELQIGATATFRSNIRTVPIYLEAP